VAKTGGKNLAIRTKSEEGNIMDNFNDAIEQLCSVVEGFTEKFETENNNQ
jgi:hypothetical protein